jgi:hypothetical protein
MKLETQQQNRHEITRGGAKNAECVNIEDKRKNEASNYININHSYQHENK